MPLIESVIAELLVDELLFDENLTPDIPHPQKISIQNQLIENYVAI